MEGINTRKSSGPDGIPGKLLQSLAKELASVLRFIFEQSLLTGDLPTDWTRANVAPVFKKGSKLQAVNYRPVSLTCITCKLFEHIICRHVLGHLEQHKILTELQHGFRSGRSCETQLITTFQDIAESYDKKGSQIDIAVLDFSKAFVTVPHDGLLSKLKHYGIDKTARVVCKKYKNDHTSVTELMWGLHWLPIRARIQYKILLLVYKAFTNGSPTYLADMMTSCNPVSSTRSSHKVNLLVVPHQKSNKYSEKAFAVVGPRLWNELLTDELRGCNSVDTFKKKLKTMLFKKHY